MKLWDTASRTLKPIHTNRFRHDRIKSELSKLMNIDESHVLYSTSRTSDWMTIIAHIYFHVAGIIEQTLTLGHQWILSGFGCPGQTKPHCLDIGEKLWSCSNLSAMCRNGFSSPFRSPGKFSVSEDHTKCSEKLLAVITRLWFENIGCNNLSH